MSSQDYPPLPSEGDTEEQMMWFFEWQKVMTAKIAMLSTQYISEGMDSSKAYILANYATWPKEYWSVLCPQLPNEIEKRQLRETRINLIIQQLRQANKLTVEELEARFSLIPHDRLE